VVKVRNCHNPPFAHTVEHTQSGPSAIALDWNSDRFLQPFQGAKMFARSLLQCAVAFAVATPMYALADSLNAKPGAWEMTTTSLTAGMPIPAEALAKMPPEQRAKIEQSMQARAGKPSTHVTKSCITKHDLDQDQVIKSDEETQCKKKIISKSATRIAFEQTCAAPHASTAKVMIEARTPESIVASMDMVQGGASGKVHVDIKGRWLGASCAGIKERG
jgi:hypothetical protein